MRPAPKESKWRLPLRRAGDWFLSARPAPIITYIGGIVATVATLVEVARTDPTGWDTALLILKWVIIGIVPGLIIFFVAKLIGWLLVWISNLRPKFFFEPKIKTWFEVDDQNQLVLRLVVANKVKGLFLSFEEQPLRYGDGFNYMDNFRQRVNTVEPLENLTGYAKNLDGPLVRAFIFGKKLPSGGYGLRIKDFLRSGFMDMTYEISVIRQGQFRDWPILPRRLSVKFAIKNGEIQLLKDEQNERAE